VNNIEIDETFVQTYSMKSLYTKKGPQEDIEEIRDYWSDEKLFDSLRLCEHEVEYIRKSHEPHAS